MSSRPVVFVAWDSTLDAVEQVFTGIRDDPDGVDVEILGAIGDLAIGRLHARLDEAVQRSAAVLAVVDQPNANMAWELGMALAKGRPIALAVEARSIGPSWVDGTPLGGILRQPDIIQHARKLIASQHTWPAAPRPPSIGTRKLVHCPEQGLGAELRRALKKLPEEWELLDTRGWVLARLPELLEGVGRLAWVQLRTQTGEVRHGVENTIGALVTAYAQACGIAVRTFDDSKCPRPIDAREIETEFSGAPKDLPTAILAWSASLDAPVATRTRTLLSTFHAAVIERHARPLAYVEAFDLHVADLQPVDLDVDVGGAVDGLERRLEGFAERRHGGLDRLVKDDLAASEAPVRWLLRAEPGAGKTTLMRRIACEQAREGGLALLVSLAMWEEKGGDPLVVALGDAMPTEQVSTLVELARFIRAEAATRGRVWLLLDGYDEVKDPKKVREGIEALAADPAWSRAVLILTSREAAVKGQQSWPGFTRAALRLLDEPRQQELVAGLLGPHPGCAAAFWVEVACRPGIAALLPNPFLLTLSVGLFLRGREDEAAGPVNRRTLLQRAVVDCLERGWRHVDAPRPDRWSPRWAHRLLRGLSLELHRRGGEAWKREVLSDALAVVPERYPSLRPLFGPGKHWESDRVFLEDIERYGGLLGPLDGQSAPWRYLHRSLRELLAAECLAEELSAAERAEVVAELLSEEGEGEDKGAGRSAEILALLAGMVPEDEAFTHLERLAEVAPQAGLRALASVEGLEAGRWLGVLTGMKPERRGDTLWYPHWNNDHLDAVLDAIGREGPLAVRALWGRVRPELPLVELGLLWYTLERLDPAARVEDFFRVCGKAELPRPKLPTRPIPAGRFQMGDDQVGPIHTVALSAPFAATTTPVTLAQLQAFDPGHDNASWKGPNVPAVMVDWFGARLFAAWIGGRLPTEAEWEYACRAGSTSAYSSGDAEADLARVGWYDSNSGNKLHPVGQKPANDWGLRDMHGNAWEWCADRFGDYPEGGAADPAGPARGPLRVLRGGSFWNGADGCRSAARSWDRPAIRDDVGIGFRVVLVAPPPAGTLDP